MNYMEFWKFLIFKGEKRQKLKIIKKTMTNEITKFLHK